MSSREEIIRHWLLNLAVEVPIGLYRIFPEVATQSLNVLEVPSCEATEYADQLLELWDSGMIEISSEVPDDDVGSAVGVAKILDRFLRLPSKSPSGVSKFPGHRRLPRHGRLLGTNVYFKLTRLGGATWEKLSEPCWSNYVWVLSDCSSGDITSPNWDRVIAFLGWWSFIHPGEHVQPETIECKTHDDFNLPYWKRFPRVYHASFRLRVSKGALTRWIHQYPQSLADWYRSVCSWYTEPWHLSGWPEE